MSEGRAKWRSENVADLGKLGLPWQTINRLQEIARALHRLDELSCNEGLSDRQEARVERLENEARALAKAHGWNVYVQGDPRGWPLYLWSDAALADYKKRHESWNIPGIDCCYSDVGVAICPH